MADWDSDHGGDAVERHLQQIYQEEDEQEEQQEQERISQTLFPKQENKPKADLPAARIERFTKHLSGVPMLRGLMEGERMKLAQHMTDITYRKDEIIILQGDVGDSFYVLYDGACRILKNGHELGTYVADPAKGIAHHFGERALLKDEPRYATVVVVSETAKALKMGRDSFNSILGPLEDILTQDLTHDQEEDLQPANEDVHKEAGDPLTHRVKVGGNTRNSRVIIASQFKRFENKLWSLGMSQEQMSRASLREERESQHRMRQWPDWRIRAYQLGHRRLFKLGILVVNIVNIICLSVAVSSPEQKVRKQAMTSSRVCRLIFFGEMAVRLAGCPKGTYWFRESQTLVVDFVLLLVAIAELGYYWLEHTQTSQVPVVLATLQVVRLWLFLNELKNVIPGLRVMFAAVSDGLTTITSAAAFVGIIWYASSACITSLVLAGPEMDDLKNEPYDQRAVDHFRTVGHSLLTIVLVTTGGKCWGDNIMWPLMMSNHFVHKLVFVALFLLVFLATFYIWNLVLGVYVRQVVLLSEEDAEDLEQQKVSQDHQRLQQLADLLKDAVADEDGYISHSMLTRTLTAKRDAMNNIGMEIEELEALYALLDVDGSEQVLLCDLFVGVLTMSGSKTFDKLSTECQQRKLLESMDAIGTTSHEKLHSIIADVDLVQRHTNFLNCKITELHDAASMAKAELRKEIERLRHLTVSMLRQAPRKHRLLQERWKQDHLERSTSFATKMDMMQAEIDHLWQSRQLSVLDKAAPHDIAALRRAVQQRLHNEVWPWLESEVAVVRATHRSATDS